MDGGYGFGGGGDGGYGGGYGGGDGGYGGGYGGASETTGYGGGGAYGTGDAGGYGSQSGPGGVGASQGSPAGRQNDNQHITPLTLKQLLSASSDHPDNSFHVDGRALSKVCSRACCAAPRAELGCVCAALILRWPRQVRVIGCITEVKNGTGFADLKIDDCTGSVSVKYWTQDPLKAAQLRYVAMVPAVTTRIA